MLSSKSFLTTQFSVIPLLCPSVSMPNVHMNCCVCIELKECLTVIGFLHVSGIECLQKT